MTRTIHFIRHYAEMVVAMFVGMFALGMPLAALLALVGIEASAWRTDAPELMLLGMALTMRSRWRPGCATAATAGRRSGR